MIAKGKTSIKENKPLMTASGLMRLAGGSAVLAGFCFIIIGFFHQENVPASVTTAVWVNVHIAATALGFFGLFGMAGLYARQMEKSGWMGLVGFLLFSLWMTIICGFSFFEAFILPQLATLSPAYVESVLGMFTSVPSTVDLGVLPMVWNTTGLLIILGPLLFGIATFRARVLPRWAGGLLALVAVLVPVGGMVPAAYQSEFIMIPLGVAITWMGFALVSERRVKTSASFVNPETSKVA